MAELEFIAGAERANCPGCGASFELKAEQAIVTCQYCGTDSKVVRRLRRLEPELPDGPPPKPPIDPSKDYAKWGCEALVWGILNGDDVTEQIKMANELDSWSHVRCKPLPGLLPQYVTYMLTAPPELDKAMRGILGKLICSKDLKLRNLVIRTGQKFGFTHAGSHGLIFALSLGDAGTVKLLLEIAEWAQEKGHEEYCHEALMGVQTAIGRERNYRHVCNQILLHRLPYVSGQVRDWILKHTRLEFDVGYTQHRSWVLELIDDMALEQPELIEPLENCLKKCGSAKDDAEWEGRIRSVNRYRTRAGKLAAIRSLGGTRHDMAPAKSQLAIDELSPWLDDEETREMAARYLGKLMWLGDGMPAPLQKLWDERGPELPGCFEHDYKLRMGIR